MSDWLTTQARALGVPDSIVGDFEVCANEAVTNAICYAWNDSEDHEIALRFMVNSEKLALEIEDDGRPFNPLENTDHPDPAGIADAPVGCLGLRIIQRMLPASRYERRNGRNVLTLSKAIA